MTTDVDNVYDHDVRVVVIVDIVESSRLIEEDENGFIARWRALVEYTDKRILPHCGGRLVKSLGDGLMLDFLDVQPAIAAALRLQQESRRRNINLSSNRHILLRIGIEISDVVIDKHDTYGRGVMLANRLVTLAGPGEIVVSSKVQDSLTAPIDGEMECLGECYLKHVRSPVRAYRVGPPGPRPVVEPMISHGDLMPTVGVIPLSGRGVNRSRGLVGEIIAEEIIRKLSGSSKINVVSRLATSVFRRRNMVLQEVGQQIKADYLVAGVYRIHRGCLRIDIEFVDAVSGCIFWAKRFDGAIDSIANGSSRMVDSVAKKVKSTVVKQELAKAASASPVNLRSHTLLIGAVTLMHRVSKSDFHHSRLLLETLLDRATRQSIPNAWMAKWHVLRVQQGWSSDPAQDGKIALEYTGRALDVDPTLPLALSIKVFVYTQLLRHMDLVVKARSHAIENHASQHVRT